MAEKKKQTTPKKKPEHVVQRGGVIGSIHLRQSNCGFPYFDFSLSRTWKSAATGKDSHGSTFFDRNEEELLEVIREICAWIRRKMTGGPATSFHPGKRQEGREKDDGAPARGSSRPSASTPDAL